MRYVILSDIHANLEALRAVMQHIPGGSGNRLILLGDIVGYGADPNAVVEEVQRLAPRIVIRGNHDKVASGVETAEGFNVAARDAAAWTSSQLSPEHRAYLEQLPYGPVTVDERFQVCHGSPLDEDFYIFEHIDAIQALNETTSPVCFFGHTHVQIGYWLSADSFDVLVPEPDGESAVPLDPERRYLINPGAVGQPRDGDPRAAFCVYEPDAQRVTWRRVEYDVAAAQRKILAAGLPEGLARRLALGR